MRVWMALAVLVGNACSTNVDDHVADTGASTPSVTSSAAATTPVIAGRDTVTVYKSPTCGCCTAWVDHMRNAGYHVIAIDTAAVDAIKRRHGVPEQLGSCHTAVVGGYVVEGHVPAADIARLLSERPDVKGIAVPGMPVGSPGMEGGTPERYDVISFGPRGTRVFARH